MDKNALKRQLPNPLNGTILKWMLLVGIFGTILGLAASSLFFWPFFFMFLFAAFFLVYGITQIHSGIFINTINSGDPKSNQVALSFDDGPDPIYTEMILDILKEESISAVFFCIGRKLESNQALVRRILAEGHLIGNHSWSHSYTFDLNSAADMAIELEQTNQKIFQITGKRTLWFRPPYGVTNPNLAKAVKQSKMETIGWSLRSLDAVLRSEAALMDRLFKKIKPGDMILLHDTQAHTARALRPIIRGIKSRGLELVSPEILLNLRANV